MRLFALVAALVSSFAFAGPNSYQVTGPVVEVKDDVVVVQKGKEKWEVSKSAATPVDGGEVKVGSKVTVHYTMSATKIEVKGAKVAKQTETAAPAATH